MMFPHLVKDIIIRGGENIVSLVKHIDLSNTDVLIFYRILFQSRTRYTQTKESLKLLLLVFPMCA